ncbi:hypothetical protein [Pararhodospirillum photometricum]|uniref:DUF2568 domain-containing protein n=1 Tax=Pararhodospirillum photometricum DSM 122 TaxID=1150469 RepID=H6SIP9_PARPM|nr:hypothetical protein [Pararhodospirillum photometricum]CCG06676.1 Putative uncharacterized protein [Pararhodospirillum photometricum DSM 122]
MSALFTSGVVIDFILLLMVVEGWVLVLLHRRSGGGLPPLGIVTLLLPGALLLAAVRAALVGAPWILVAFILLLSFVAHIADVLNRWRS